MIDHQKWMNLALSLASSARCLGDVPVGAIIVRDHEVLATGFNRREADCVSLRHAELIAIERACKRLRTWRLIGCKLYVTLEPCLMCAGAIVQSRIPEVYFGAPDPKGGAFGSLYTIQDDSRLNHRVQCTGGILADVCSEQLRNFFKDRRNGLLKGPQQWKRN